MNKTKILHTLFIGSLIGFVTLVTFVIVRLLLTHSLVPLLAPGVKPHIAVREEALNESLTPTISLSKDSSGVYVLPTADPLNPLALGPETVGGVTACERLFNLKQCLIRKNSTLEARLVTPVASASAGLNDACGLILNEASDIRPASFELGCIW